MPTCGGKVEITERITYFLETGKVLPIVKAKKKTPIISNICEDTKTESNFVCSETHRVFFKEHIGNTFSFNVIFQKWLKNNEGKTYRDAISVYFQIIEDSKKEKTSIINSSSTIHIYVIFFQITKENL